MVGQAKLRRQELQRDVTGLQEIIRKLEKHEAWKTLGMLSLGALCQRELDLDERQVDLIRKAKGGTSLEAVIERAKNPPLTNPNGRPKKGSKPTVSGRGADYLTARIARDRPDVLKRMEAGEFSSVRQAAIAAGVVKVPTPLDLLRRAWAKASKAEKDDFVEWIGKEGW
jgi:hypothetical protein